MAHTLPTFCGKDCGGDACPLSAVIEEGRVTRIINNPAGGKYLRGCWRGHHLLDAHNAPDRLLHPLVRVGPRGSGQFRRASWDEALDQIAAALTQVRSQYGPQAVLSLASAGCSGALHGTYGLLTRFLHRFGGCTELTSNYSNGAASFMLPYLYGDAWRQSGFDAATLRYSQMIILWGANVLETRMGTEVPMRLMEAKERGAQIVVMDPRRSDTVAQAATWWLPCRPGSDAALMLAVLYVLFNENLADRAFIQAHAVGMDALERHVLGLDGGPARTPEWAAPLCGLPAEEIARFARAYAAAKPAALFPGYSIQRVFAGEDTYRLSAALQIATANFGVLGGSTGSINSRLPAPRVGSLPVERRPHTPSLPILRWPDAVLQGRSGGYPSDLRAIYALGGNFVNQGADVHKNCAAFAAVDFAVTHEMFLTPTARWCDVVLPAAGPLEKEDIGIPWLGNYLLYKSQIVPPPGEARTDYDIFCALAERMGFGPEFSQGRSAAQWVELFIQESEIPDPQAFRRTGLYLAPNQERTGLAEFSANPQRHPLPTPSGKVEIASARYAADTGFPAVPIYQPPPADPRFPLLLLTPKSRYRTHSQGSNLPAVRQRADDALEMHPADAAARGLREGDVVRLFNANGAARLRLRLNAEMISGIVVLPEGIWFELDENGEDLAGSANLFTSTQGTAPAAACIMHAVGVEVAAS